MLEDISNLIILEHYEENALKKKQIKNNKISLLNKINKSSKSEKKISPIINRKAKVIIEKFNDLDEVIEYKNELEFYLLNEMTELLFNTRLEFKIENKKLVIFMETNNYSYPFLLKTLKEFKEEEALSIGLKFKVSKKEEITPYHCQIDTLKNALFYIKNNNN